MIVKQIFLAVILLFVAFVMEVTRRIISGEQPYTFFYGHYLWILLFVSAQPPFLSKALRKGYKLAALTIGVIAGLIFDSLIGPLFLTMIFPMIQGAPIIGISILIKLASILIAFIASKAAVEKLQSTDAPESTGSTLRASEQVIKKGAANLQKGYEAVGGTLCLTNNQLVFEAHNFNLQVGTTVVELSNIQTVRKCWTKLFGILPLFPNSLAVRTIQGDEYHFVLVGRSAWLAAIEAQLNGRHA